MWSRVTLAALYLTGCARVAEQTASERWTAVQQAESDEVETAAARDVCQMMTPRVAHTVGDHLGAFVGKEAEIYLAAGVATFRPQGIDWLAHRVYSASLDEAFSDVIEPGVEALPRLDWPALVDALTICAPDEPEANRWLGLLAMAEDGDSSSHVRALIDSDPAVRRRVRTALDGAGMPSALTSSLLSAFGAPRDGAEATWLTHRYADALASSIELRPVGALAQTQELVNAWRVAFPDRSLPLPAGDRQAVESLPHLVPGDDEDMPDGALPFGDLAAFMTRHRLTGWADVLALYARWHALPSDALSFVCHASASECAETLRGGAIANLASAADVAPALDLDQGEIALSTACDALPSAEARMLAERGLGAEMSYAIREAAAGCFTLLGDDTTSQWHDLLLEAIAARRWRDADRAASISPNAVDDSMRRAAIDGVRSGQIRALDAASMLTTSEEGTEIFRAAVAELNTAVLQTAPADTGEETDAPVPPPRPGRTAIIRLDAIIGPEIDAAVSPPELALRPHTGADRVF